MPSVDALSFCNWQSDRKQKSLSALLMSSLLQAIWRNDSKQKEPLGHFSLRCDGISLLKLAKH